MTIVFWYYTTPPLNSCNMVKGRQWQCMYAQYVHTKWTYCIVRKFGRELNLALYLYNRQILQTNCKILIPTNISGYTVLLTLKVYACSVRLMMPSNCPHIEQGLDIDRLATVRLWWCEFWSVHTTTATTEKDNMSISKEEYLSRLEDPKLRVSVRCICLIWAQLLSRGWDVYVYWHVSP